jgi:hypothetical protein
MRSGTASAIRLVKRTASALAVCTACAAAPAKRGSPAGEPSSPGHTAVAEAHGTEFFVVAEGLEGFETDRNQLRLSDVKKAIFLRYPPLVFRDGRFVDAGLVNGQDPTGTWPDALWALRTPDCLANQPDDDRPPVRPGCPEGHDVVHWRAEGWVKMGFLPAQVGRPTPVAIAAWPALRAIGMVQHMRGKNLDRVNELSIYGPLPHPALPHRWHDGEPSVEFVEAIGDEEALVFRSRGPIDASVQYIERWSSDRRSAQTDEPANFRLLRAFAWTDITGAVEVEGKPPRGVRFDGTRWVDFELPAWGAKTSSYDREPNGTEWVVMDSGRQDQNYNPLETRLYRRSASDVWRAVALPSPVFMQNGGKPRIEPTDVRAEGNGDVWVRGRYQDGCDRGVILHTQKPAELCFLEPGARRCTAAPKPRGPTSPCRGRAARELSIPQARRTRIMPSTSDVTASTNGKIGAVMPGQSATRMCATNAPMK